MQHAKGLYNTINNTSHQASSRGQSAKQSKRKYQDINEYIAKKAPTEPIGNLDNNTIQNDSIEYYEMKQDTEPDEKLKTLDYELT